MRGRSRRRGRHRGHGLLHVQQRESTCSSRTITHTVHRVLQHGIRPVGFLQAGRRAADCPYSHAPGRWQRHPHVQFVIGLYPAWLVSVKLQKDTKLVRGVFKRGTEFTCYLSVIKSACLVTCSLRVSVRTRELFIRLPIVFSCVVYVCFYTPLSYRWVVHLSARHFSVVGRFVPVAVVRVVCYLYAVRAHGVCVSPDDAPLAPGSAAIVCCAPSLSISSGIVDAPRLAILLRHNAKGLGDLSVLCSSWL